MLFSILLKYSLFNTEHTQNDSFQLLVDIVGMSEIDHYVSNGKVLEMMQ